MKQRETLKVLIKKNSSCILKKQNGWSIPREMVNGRQDLRGRQRSCRVLWSMVRILDFIPSEMSGISTLVLLKFGARSFVAGLSYVL